MSKSQFESWKKRYKTTHENIPGSVLGSTSEKQFRVFEKMSNKRLGDLKKQEKLQTPEERQIAKKLSHKYHQKIVFADLGERRIKSGKKIITAGESDKGRKIVYISRHSLEPSQRKNPVWKKVIRHETEHIRHPEYSERQTFTSTRKRYGFGTLRKGDKDGVSYAEKSAQERRIRQL